MTSFSTFLSGPESFDETIKMSPIFITADVSTLTTETVDKKELDQKFVRKEASPKHEGG